MWINRQKMMRKLIRKKTVFILVIFGLGSLSIGSILSTIHDSDHIAYSWTSSTLSHSTPLPFKPRFLHAIRIQDQVLLFALDGQGYYLPASLICIDPSKHTNASILLPIFNLGIIPLCRDLDVQYDAIRNTLHFFVLAHPTTSNSTFLLELYHISLPVVPFPQLTNTSLYSIEKITNLGGAIPFYGNLIYPSFGDSFANSNCKFFNYPMSPSAWIGENGEIWLTYEIKTPQELRNNKIMLIHQQNGIWNDSELIGEGENPCVYVNSQGNPLIYSQYNPHSVIVHGSIIEWSIGSTISSCFLESSLREIDAIPNICRFYPGNTSSSNVLAPTFLIYQFGSVLYAHYRTQDDSWSSAYLLASSLPNEPTLKASLIVNTINGNLDLFYFENSQIIHQTGLRTGLTGNFLLNRYVIVQDYFVLPYFNAFYETVFSVFIYMFSSLFWLFIPLLFLNRQILMLRIPYSFRIIDETIEKITKNHFPQTDMMFSRQKLCVNLLQQRLAVCRIRKSAKHLLPTDSTPFSQSISDFLTNFDLEIVDSTEE